MLIGACRGETLSHHVIDFDQWEHAKTWRCTIMGNKAERKMGEQLEGKGRKSGGAWPA